MSEQLELGSEQVELVSFGFIEEAEIECLPAPRAGASARPSKGQAGRGW
ncbi:hypothetical protein [Mesorhizobium captivum]|nr:hypothetical protein [Mesorhizobium sp. VK23E]MDX8515177.1 hypothetical protein [Mesorhizobium sp. VK23E]